MTLLTTTHMSAQEFREQLTATEPGKSFTYAAGFIAGDIGKATLLKLDFTDLAKVQGAAWSAYECGNAHLTQRRIGPFQFEYIATRATNGGANKKPPQ